jgi:hypothetical protein
VEVGSQLTFNFRNLHNQSKLYSQGLRPVYRAGNAQWRRIPAKVSFQALPDQFSFSFSHQFLHEQPVFFAFSYPFSYQQSIEQMDLLQTKLAHQHNIYFNRELLCYSLEGRRVEIVTISSKDGLMDKKVPVVEDIYPEGNQCRQFGSKKVVFLTSRVHPGETPGSHVLNGFIDLLSE